MRLALAAAALGLAQLAAAAEEPPKKASDVLKAAAARPYATPINDRFAVRASYFPASISTDLRLDDAVGNPGTALSAEDDLGMKDKLDQGRVELMVRMRERNRVRVDYYKLTRRGDEVLRRTIDFGDETFTANDRVLSRLDWRMLNLTYLYSVFHNQRFEMGAGAALHLFEGEARARVPTQALNEEQSGVAAFPTLALDATLRIAKRFSVNARANYLSADIDDSSGSVSDFHLDAQYRWRRNFAVGLGYTMLKTKLDIADADDLSGRFVFDVKGPELFFRASF